MVEYPPCKRDVVVSSTTISIKYCAFDIVCKASMKLCVSRAIGSLVVYKI